MPHVAPELKELFFVMEKRFQPLKICRDVHAVLSTMKEDEEYAHYIEFIQDITVIRMLKQVCVLILFFLICYYVAFFLETLTLESNWEIIDIITLISLH